MVKLPYRFFFLLFAFANMIVGLLAGLGRLGWAVPVPAAYVHHGAIMVGGFLGSLIALEKIIPLKKPLFFTGPVLSASSILVFTTGDFQEAVFMLIFAGVIFILVYVAYLRQHYSLYLVIALVGAGCWTVGNVLLLWKKFYPLAFPWWMGFLLFTIVSERLELSKFLPVSRQTKHLLLALLIFFLVGIIMPFHSVGTYVSGLALVCISLWLLRNDVIRLTIRKQGVVRFTATALLIGYFCLLLQGIFLITLRDSPLGYDITLHTFFVGFVFSMIFAHGPIILPGVLGLSVKPYSPLFYVPLIGLFFSLAMRIAANVTLIDFSYRGISGWVTAGSILLYFFILVATTIKAARHATSA
ncbi:MAG: hypothetical protein KF845_06140 [Cyclobacteriaceae bacterium]|nr:hypothetical protein [Cyclobacteriaceae bacterium]